VVEIWIGPFDDRRIVTYLLKWAAIATHCYGTSG
jgi:hypothetical protein